MEPAWPPEINKEIIVETMRVKYIEIINLLALLFGYIVTLLLGNLFGNIFALLLGYLFGHLMTNLKFIK